MFDVAAALLFAIAGGRRGDMSEPPARQPAPSVEGPPATLAHEVNSPLAVVTASLELTLEALARLEAEIAASLPGEAERAALGAHLAEARALLEEARIATVEMKEAVARRTPPPARPSEPRTLGPAPDAARVLVVDDLASVGRTLERLLRGYEVVALVDPREALDRLTGGERFAAILCDLMMPGMTGAELYTRLARIDPEQASRVIFVTGGILTPEVGAFVAGAGQPVLAKPFAIAELREEVARMAALPAAPAVGGRDDDR